MAEVVNLRTERKRREKAKDRAKAVENAVRYGRTKVQKDLEQTRAERAAALIEAHQREGREE
ncbi:MAG: DUF4169 family protein [Albidovulum sp.]|uniref:DUF4169 family protein n=1 Tax=Albidovulum sp. TaxID=1872424 RepID=UPI003C9B82BD